MKPALDALQEVVKVVKTESEASWSSLCDSRLVAAIVHLMRHKQPNVHKTSMHVMKALVFPTEGLRAMFVLHGTVPLLLPCIRQGSMMDRERAMSVLLLLFNEPTGVKAAVEVPDAVDSIARLLNQSSEHEVMMESAAGLGYLLEADNALASKRVLSRGVMKLVQILEHGPSPWKSKVHPLGSRHAELLLCTWTHPLLVSSWSKRPVYKDESALYVSSPQVVALDMFMLLTEALFMFSIRVSMATLTAIQE